MFKRFGVMVMALFVGLMAAVLLMSVGKSDAWSQDVDAIGHAFAVTQTSKAEKLQNNTVAELHVCLDGCMYSSVQAAIDDAENGDVIKVAAGKYTDINNYGGAPQVVYISKTVTLQGGFTTTNWLTPDPENNKTILDAQEQGRVMRLGGNSAVEGFYMTGGSSLSIPFFKSGIGVLIVGDATLRHNTIYSNTGGFYGGGVCSFYSTVTLVGNTIISNNAVWGGGVYLLQSHGTLNDNVIASNIAFACGGIDLVSSSADVSGNLVVHNRAVDHNSYGGGLCLSTSDANLKNNVIAENATYSDGAIWISNSSPRFMHNTIANNHGAGGVFLTENSTSVFTNTILVGHSKGIEVEAGNTAILEGTLWGTDTWANAHDWYGSGTIVTGTVNIWGYPEFIDFDGGNYHIGETSAARDSGVDSDVFRDIDGQIRPMGLMYDIGVDEYPGVGLDATISASDPYLNPGQMFTYSIVVASAGDASATGVVMTDTLDAWQRATAVESPSGNCTITDSDWGGEVVCTPGTMDIGESVVVTLTAQNSTEVLPRQIMVNHVTITANETVKDIGFTTYAQDCHARINDSATDFTHIQTAVDTADNGDLIKVAGYCVGVMEREGNLQQIYLDKSLTIRGGYTTTNWLIFNPETNPSILDALWQGRVLYVTANSSPTIEGLQITGGDASASASIMGRGGGAYIAAPVAWIKDNRIYRNRAYAGGGLALSSSNANLSGNTIELNTATVGGGLYLVYSDATLNRNAFIANTADDQGGGVFFGVGNTTLVNNLVADNQAGDHGSGLYVIASSPQLLHTTIARNTGGDGSGVYVTGIYGDYTSPVLTNTILVSQVVGIRVAENNTATLNGVLWSGNGVNTDGAGLVTVSDAITGTVAFVDPEQADYHIGSTSFARDAGVNSGVNEDIDGHDRPWGSAPDLGADEWTTCPFWVHDVGISGPTSGDPNTAYQFSAVVDPSWASEPITYLWQPEPGIGQGTTTVTYTFATTATYAITVSASNCGGSSIAHHQIVIGELEGPSKIYLPLVVRQ